MDRRELLRLLGAAGLFSSVPAIVKETNGQETVGFRARGSGPFLFLGPPLVDESPVIQGYLDGLTDSYTVITAEYRPVGFSGATPEAISQSVVDSFTADRVSADILAVADAAGADRFAWYGYSFGGVMGLQLAARTDRLTALVCGGWPPLGAAYGEALEAAVTVEERRDVPRLFSTYYRSIVGWPEREAVSKFRCPRMVFAGSDDTSYSIGPLVAEHREELEEMGWTVELVKGHKHDLFTRADIVVPMIRQFLDPSLL